MKSLLVISPCRNEMDFLEKSVMTVLAQTVLPDLWVIVDDGSTDGTEIYLQELARNYDFVKVVRRVDRGFRKVGAGVVDAFYDGLETVDLDEFEFVCKLDLDLALPSRYFQSLLELMRMNPRLGTCSGKPFVRDSHGRVRFEPAGDEMSVGMTKFYRAICFKQIGGFVREVMWDGIDCHMCRLSGWMAMSQRHENLNFEHLRPMGSSQKNIFVGKRRHGYGQYYMGTSLAFIVASCVFRIFEPPLVIGSILTLYEYVYSAVARRPRLMNPGFREFLRAYQRRALVFGKARAVHEIDERNGNVLHKFR